jgi:hypothetical protein
MPTSDNLIKKKPGEKLNVAMDFGQWLASADSIASITNIIAEYCDGATNLTFSGTGISGTRVIFTVEGGTAGIRYKVIVTITTTLGEILIGDGILAVY